LHGPLALSVCSAADDAWDASESAVGCAGCDILRYHIVVAAADVGGVKFHQDREPVRDRWSAGVFFGSGRVITEGGLGLRECVVRGCGVIF